MAQSTVVVSSQSSSASQSSRYLSPDARAHILTHTLASTRPHRYGTTYTGARANHRAHAQRRRRPWWPARRMGWVRRAGRRRRPRPRGRRLVPSAATANRRARRSRVCRSRQRTLAAHDRSGFYILLFYSSPRPCESMMMIINNFLH